MLVKRRHSRPIPEGATILEKDGRPHARWVNKKGKTQTQPLNRKGTRVVFESDAWYVRLTDPETGKLREWRAYTDRQASQAKEVEIIRQLERGEMGLVDRQAKARRQAISKHLFDFEAHLETKDNTTDHIDKTISRCNRIVDELGIKTFAQITGEKVDECLAGWRRGGMSVGTSNGYFRALRTFCRWMVRTNRSSVNPVAGLSCIKLTDANKKRRRRPLTDAEAMALIDAARRSDAAPGGVVGPDRAMLYLVAINTGLRASELASLTPESFELDSEPPVVRCQGGYTKNGEEAVLPLRSAILPELRDWLAAKQPTHPIWPGKWAANRHGAEMIRTDLAAARIPEKDAQGRVIDFHALRHTFISNLARAGVHPRNAQALARHSTIDLTMNTYTHVSQNELAADIETLNQLATPRGAPRPSHVLAGLPKDLTPLVANWDSLHDHVRIAIMALAGV